MTIFYWVLITFAVISALLLGLVLNYGLKQGISRAHRVCFIVIIIFSSLSLYAYLGDTQGLSAYYANQSRQIKVKQLAQGFDDPAKVIQRMQAILAKHPKSAKGWYLLGRLYDSQGQLEPAIKAYERSLAYKQQPATLLHYAIALYIKNGKTITPKVQAVLDALLELSPHHPDVLVFLAQDAMSHGQSQKALYYLKQLRKQAADDVSIKQVNQMIQKTKARLSENAKHILVHVSLADKLKNKLNPTASVFIYAKAINGSNMPLAVARCQLSDLPLEITLSAADAIMPEYTIENHDRVEIIARVSTKGNAQVSPGDWYGKQIIQRLAQETNAQVIIQTVITQNHTKL